VGRGKTAIDVLTTLHQQPHIELAKLQLHCASQIWWAWGLVCGGSFREKPSAHELRECKTKNKVKKSTEF
jgi:hypothetical protein